MVWVCWVSFDNRFEKEEQFINFIIFANFSCDSSCCRSQQASMMRLLLLLLTIGVVLAQNNTFCLPKTFSCTMFSSINAITSMLTKHLHHNQHDLHIFTFTWCIPRSYHYLNTTIYHSITPSITDDHDFVYLHSIDAHAYTLPQRTSQFIIYIYISIVLLLNNQQLRDK